MVSGAVQMGVAAGAGHQVEAAVPLQTRVRSGCRLRVKTPRVAQIGRPDDPYAGEIAIHRLHRRLDDALEFFLDRARGQKRLV